MPSGKSRFWNKLYRVHRRNSKYGHKQILAEYCEINPEVPILGEVQHSLFLSTHHFDSAGIIGPPRKSGREGIPFFSWNSLLPFHRQIPIGDPAIYMPRSALVFPNSIEPAPPTVRTLVMPKFNEELALTDRLQDYVKLIEFACEYFDSSSIVLGIHPADHAGNLAIRSHADKQGLQMLERRQVDDRSRLSWELNHLFAECNLVSDYPGAHVFRAQLCSRGVVKFLLPKNVSPAYHPHMRKLLEAYSLAPGEERMQIAARVLGLPHRREPEELREILYCADNNLFRMQIWVAAYKRKRSFLVHLRNSRFWGKSPLMKWVRRRLLRPHWQRKFGA